MIIVDFNGTMIAAIMAAYHLNDYVELEENLIRHMILNSLRIYKLKFEKEYGKLIISCDDKDYWRKKFFPYYKIKRKKSMEESAINWQEIHNYMDKIKKEVKENFPYTLIQVDNAESDDIIATLVKEYHSKEKILICSRDKDFRQLHSYENVTQFDPIKDIFMKEENPEKYLFEHIVKGDSGDSIPNILSTDNSIATSIRQKPVFQKKLDEWFGNGLPEEHQLNFERNKKLIDLSQIPEEISEKILLSYSNQINKKKSNLLNYFIKSGLKEMLINIQDF